MFLMLRIIGWVSDGKAYAAGVVFDFKMNF